MNTGWGVGTVILVALLVVFAVFGFLFLFRGGAGI